AIDRVPPRHVQTVYHYTTAENWKTIQRTGKLEPRSTPHFGSMIGLFLSHIPQENPRLKAYWQNNHIVGGVDDVHFTAWKLAGSHDNILSQVAKGSNELVLLSFPASIVRGAYMKEINH